MVYKQILCVVGSSCAKPEDSKPIIREHIYLLWPVSMISGECHKGGVDIHAREVAEELMIRFKPFPAQYHRWHGRGGFQERNEKMANLCTHLLRIVSHRSRTYGSGWTADYAERLGKTVIRKEVP